MTSDLSLLGTNSVAKCTVPTDHAVEISVSGTNTDLFVGGTGSITLSLSGTNCTAVVAPTIDATITKSAPTAEVRREPIPDDQKPGHESGTAVTTTHDSVETSSISDLKGEFETLAEEIGEWTDEAEAVDDAVADPTDSTDPDGGGPDTKMFIDDEDGVPGTDVDTDDGHGPDTRVYPPARSADDPVDESPTKRRTCPSCGADLHNHDGPRHCPECGVEL